LRWAAAQWVPDVARHGDGHVSPLRAADLSGLPAAVVVTAEHDQLRDEGFAYAARLAAAGVPVTYRCEPGLAPRLRSGHGAGGDGRPSNGSSRMCVPAS
jgi:acetyl esterase